MSNIIITNKKNVNGSWPPIAFLGTPDFAVPILEELISNGSKPAAVFCAPDKPVGRKQVLTPPPVKILAQEHNIPIYQPADKIELSHSLLAISPKLVITAAYGLILPKDVLEAPEYGCLNVHPSLLPKYRGPSPIQSAILNGDSATGVTIYKMDEQIDHGAIIAKSEWPLANSKITTPELSKELASLGADLLIKILPDWLAGHLAPTPQDDSQATFTKIITKEDGRIDWRKSANEIERQIRAYTPWPGSSSQWPITNDEWQKIKILEAEASKTTQARQPGEVFLTDADDLAIQTAHGALLVKKLQPAGGQPMNAADFLRGHGKIIGAVME